MSSAREGMRTPWGKADHVRVYAEGVAFVGTPGHGGIKLDRKRQSAMPEALRLKGGWYEEDVEYARVKLAFPELLPDMSLESAQRRIKDVHPEVWEAWTGEKVSAAESYVVRRREFEAAHADKWVVISAVGAWYANGSKVPKGFVGVWATKGGRRQGVGLEQKTFLVPEVEYDVRTENGFVVDPARHEQISSL
jgi:hypothetical protein